MTLPFAPSTRSSVGLEWELMLADRETGDLVGRAPEILDLVEDATALERFTVTGELLTNTVEVTSGVGHTVAEAVDDMRALKGGLISRVTVHAIDAKGAHKVVAVNGAGDNVYWLWEGTGEPRQCPAEPVVITRDAARPTATTRFGGR